MKQTLIKLTLIASIITLTACSTNTQDQNTAIGAGTGAVVGGLAGSIGGGWAIAAGAVVGAVFGGVIGHSMDSSDNMNMNTAMTKNSINEPSNWTNNKTGTWYKIVPTSAVMTYKGSTYCRHYIAYGKSSTGQTFKTKGIACRGADGMWQQVR